MGHKEQIQNLINIIIIESSFKQTWSITGIERYIYRLYIIYYNYKGIKWEPAQQVNH